ncbi:MAG: sigma-70 family RNA polymerase sigma factor [Nitrospina sp.]|jgi:RNA polymerase sigma-32 factor|nr:sigma-70 family RNA polymerase sigma factor [Nitrospina sp.]MBT3508591.1 sigma-70 family RNA polymerase sigma factor [Nitrospina sp.]MBT3875367.1 sigma-70 family RNA polymerase sigma factor [Nitrospina sp.]MBT4048548.1 sigma-70 family RNA polymerase sigma factor [Nitrospina sp.]MBT4558976.1 sigma-70 family RNA polymerase sigma factor [Nitrospina sp.]
MNDETKFELDQPDQKKSLVPAVRAKGSLVPLDPFSAYMQEVRKYPALSEEEEKELAILYKESGDLDAAYKLTTANLMLVIKIAMTFKREWQNLMDLVQEGNIGLMKAVKNFDPFRGVRLSAYATWWIKSYILKHILDNWRLVRVGTTNARRKLLFNLKKEKEKLEQEGFDPTTKLLAERFGVDEGEIIDVSASIGAMDVSIDTPVRPDSPMTPAQTLSQGGLSVERNAELSQFRQILKENIENFKDGLNPNEIEILTERVLSEDPLSLQEIGERRGVTREAVRQAEQRLLKKFKIFIEENMPEAADYFQN